MKKLLLCILLLPFASFGQKFEISELVGCDPFHSFSIKGQAHNGLSNELKASYSFCKHASLSAFYGMEVPQIGYAFYGLSPEFTSKYFYLGIDAKVMTYKYIGDEQQYGTRYNRAQGYGMHIGSRQNLGKHLSFLEELGYSKTDGTARQFWSGIIDYVYPVGTTQIPVEPPPYYTVNVHLESYYLRAGLAYKF